LSEDRIPTGIAIFDDLIERGFPRGSLILVAGNAGSGKTNFAAQYMYHGLSRMNEYGVYASVAEDRATFYRNMKRMKMDFEKYEREGTFRFMDFITTREEAVKTILQSILDQVDELKARRLVIDPFSALMQALPNQIDARILLHTLLGKTARQKGVTTLLVSEKPLGSETKSMEVEEFVCDGIVLLNATPEAGTLRRTLQVIKLRGTKIKSEQHRFEVDENGIRMYTAPVAVAGPIRF